MKYRLFYIAILFTALLAVTSCNSCSDGKKQATNGGTVNPKVQELDETPDSAMFVTLNDYNTDSVYVTCSKTKQRKAYAYQQAMAEGQVKGTLKKGNKYSIYPDNANRRLVIAINVTELSQHKWFYDQQQHRGIEFNDRGGMSSINAEDICFREWKLLNGKLYIYYVSMQQHADDRQKYEVEEAELRNLSTDRLVLQFKGKTYDCQKESDAPLMFHP